MEAVSKLSIQSALPADVYALLADFCDRHPHEHVWTSVTLLLARTGYLLGSKARVSVAGFDWEDNLKFSDHETWEIEKWCPAISEVSAESG